MSFRLEVFLNRFYSALVPAVFAALTFATAASAQTPANITVLQGNGQMICPFCPSLGVAFPSAFDGMYVKVTDSNGNPVANSPVTWIVTSGQGQLTSNSSGADTTYTNASGIATEGYFGFTPSTSTAATAFIQSSVSASISNGSGVTFYETVVTPNLTITGNNGAPVQVSVQTTCAGCISPGDTLSGNAGSTSSTPFVVQVYAPGSATPVIPNVAVRLIPNQTSPTISCATGPGADPGSVLTDANGNATCTPIIGSTTGTGTFYIQVGGVPALGLNPANGPQGYFQSGNYVLKVLPGVPGSVAIVSGNNQTANPGQALAFPLIATVADAAGNPLSGQSVTWTVSPSGGATLSNTTTSSNSNGQVQTNVTLASSTAGSVQVKVALAGNPNISATFNITANVQITGLQFLISNATTLLVNSSTPITVQVNAGNGQTASGIPVNFTVSGPATLSSGTAVTNSSGQATVAAISGAATGTVTITATTGSQSATYIFSVIPAGPSVTSGSFYNGADFQAGSISPCGIATIIAPGIAPTLSGVATSNQVGSMPYALAGVQVLFNGAPSPIYNVANVNGQQQVTFQVPCNVTPGSSPVTVNVGGGTATVSVTVKPASPGLFMSGSGSTAVPVLERPDGSFVSASNPARRGEQLIAYVTGLGPTTPSVATNAVPAPGSNPTIQGTVIVGIDGNGAPFTGAAVSPDIVGVEMVTFVVPSSIPTGTATFSIGVLYPSSGSTVYYSGLGMFPVQ